MKYSRHRAGQLGMTLGAVVVSSLLGMHGTVVHAQESWTARTVAQVQADMLALPNGSSYQVVWGDTLWAISEASQIDMDILVQINNISDRNVIYAGTQIAVNHDAGRIVVVEPNEQAATIYQVVTSAETQDVIAEQTVQLSENTTVREAEVRHLLNANPSQPVVTSPETPVTTEEIVVETKEIGHAIAKPADTPAQVLPANITIVNTELITDATSHVIGRVETKEERQQITHAVTYMPSHQLAEGAEVVLAEGKPGVSVRKFSEEYDAEGRLLTTTELSLDVTEPEARVVQIGLGVQTEEIIQSTTTLAVEEERIETDELFVGQSELVQDGSAEKHIHTFKVLKKDGKEISRELLDTVVEAGTKRIVRVGTKDDIRTQTVVVDEAVSHSIRYIDDEQLIVGTQKTVTAGQNGKKTVTYTETYTNGQLTHREKQHEVEVEAPKEAVIRRGTKTTEVTVNTRVIEPVEEVTLTDQLRRNQEEVLEAGEPGEELVTTTTVYNTDGSIAHTDVARKTVKPAKPRRIKRGTGIVEQRTITESSPIAFSVNYIDDNTLLSGTIVDVSSGKEGRITRTIAITTLDGVETSRQVINEVRQEATPAVKKRGTNTGTAIVDQDGYKTRYEKTLPATFEQLDVQGTEAERRDAAKRTEYVAPYDYDATSINKINQLFDQKVFTMHLLGMVNQLRRSENVGALQLSDELNGYAAQRSSEQAQYGSLRTNNQPHTRPDGSKWSTVIPRHSQFNYHGENIAQYTGMHNPHQYVSELFWAEQFYTQWLNSSGHRKNMLNANYTHMGSAVFFGPDSKSDGVHANKNTAIGTQVFGARR